MIAVPDAAMLSAMPLFEHLTDEQLDLVKAHLRAKTFPAGSILMSAEQPAEIAYIIQCGTVKVHVEQENGSDVLLTLLGPNEIIGEMGLIENSHRSATVVTLEQSTLLWMGREAFRECLHTIPTMAVNLLRIISRRLRLATTQYQLIATRSVRGRVAGILLALAQAYGRSTEHGDVMIPLLLKQHDLASMVGASRGRVNEVLSLYQREAIISLSPHSQRYLIIHDMCALEHDSRQ